MTPSTSNETKRRAALACGLCALVGASAAHAQIATDGSVGAATTLSGPNFQILETLGRREGNNLFHSFRDFNLVTGQSATFVGSANLSNVIARVTGGSPSQVNGRIALQGPTAANLWLVNPAGWVFGSGASLDLPGSVYLSTASALTLGGGGRYEAATNRPSTFTSAPPEAFVMGASPAAVRVQGTLAVRDGRSISVAAGSIDLDGGSLRAAGGRVDLAAAGAGTVTLGSNGLDLGTGQTGGEIRLSRSADQIPRGINNLDVSSTSTTLTPGTVRIRGGQLIAAAGGINADHRSDQGGGRIDVEMQQAVRATGASSFSAVARGSGRGADLRVAAPTIDLAGSTALRTDTRVSAQGGSLSLSGSNITLREQARLESTVIGSGRGGAIDVRATGTLEVRDQGSIRTRATLGSGDAGSIALAAERINIRDDGTLQSSTAPDSTGNGGSLTLSARRIDITGDGQGNPGDSTLLSTEARGSGTGGVLSITAEEVNLRGRTLVSSSTEGPGNAGDVRITADRLRIEEGSVVRSNASGNGRGGDVAIAAGDADLVDAVVSANASGRGDAGAVRLSAADLRLTRSAITTAATTSDGGNIALTVPGDLWLTDSLIGTSVQSGVGNGGNVAIAEPELLLLRRSAIQANAFGGNGGNIGISAGPLVASGDSVIEASSQLGLDGTVFLEVPQIDLAGSLLDPRLGVQVEVPAAVECGGDGGESTVRAAEVVTTWRITSAFGGVLCGG